MPRKNAFRPARIEGAEPDPAPARVEGDSALVEKYPEAEKVSRGPLGDIVETFKAMHPELWEQIRLGPTQHGLQQMIEVLDA